MLVPATSKISPENYLPLFRLLMFFHVFHNFPGVLLLLILILCECSHCFVEYDRRLNYFLGIIIRFHRRIRINSNNLPGKLENHGKASSSDGKVSSLGEKTKLEPAKTSIKKLQRSIPAIYFLNKCDISTLTDVDIVKITAIYKDKSEIPACFDFECSSASEGVRNEAKRVEHGKLRVRF